MSYWTYSDLFEEPGPPPTPFHGGFGLLNREGIRKPAYFAYTYLHSVQGKEIPSPDAEVLAAEKDGNVSALVWDFEPPVQKLSNRSFYGRLVPNVAGRTADLTIRHLAPGNYDLQIRRTGYRANDAYSAYLDMGSPAQLTPAQLKQLSDLTRDLPETERTLKVGLEKMYRVSIPMRSNDVVLIALETTGGSGASKQ